MKLSKRTLLTSTALTTSLISGCATTLQFQDARNIPSISVDDSPQIQNVCPQLQNVQLKTSNLEDVPHFEVDKKGVFYLEGQVRGTDGMKDVLYSNGALLTNGDSALSDDPIANIKKFSNLAVIFYINTNGGNTYAFNQVNSALDNRKAITFTFATEQAESGGFGMLNNGDWRFVKHDTQLMVHPTKFYIHENNNLALPNSGIPFLASVFNFKNPIMKPGLIYQNNKDIKLLEEHSATNITHKCASSLLNDYYDTHMTPESALRLGFVDAVINEYDGTITYREKEVKPLPEGLPFKPPFVVIMPPLG